MVKKLLIRAVLKKMDMIKKVWCVYIYVCVYIYIHTHNVTLLSHKKE